MFERFTERAREAVRLAHNEAERFNRNYVGTEHLLLGLTDEPEGVAARVLVAMGADPEAVRQEVFRTLGVEPATPPPDRPVERPRHPRPFYRSNHDRAIAGVCGGIAEYFGWDPRLVRLAVAGLIIAACDAGLAAYLLFWIFVPLRPSSDRRVRLIWSVQFLIPLGGLGSWQPRGRNCRIICIEVSRAAEVMGEIKGIAYAANSRLAGGGRGGGRLRNRLRSRALVGSRGGSKVRERNGDGCCRRGSLAVLRFADDPLGRGLRAYGGTGQRPGGRALGAHLRAGAAAR